MNTSVMSNPWQTTDSDHEEEFNPQYSFCITSTERSVTPKIITRRHVPRIPDWDPVINVENTKATFGRKKTAPIVERAPSYNRPIFSGSHMGKLGRNGSVYGSCTSLSQQNKLNITVPSYNPETPATPRPVNNPTFDPFKLMCENLSQFIYRYIPKDHSSFIRCYLRRDKSGIQKGFFPTYYLQAERPGDGKKIFLLSARKTAKINRQSDYLITTNVESLSEKHGGDGCVGRLRANNLAGTEYTLFDNGKSPNKYGYKPWHSKHGLRRELSVITYNSNNQGSKGPRQMNILIPKLDYDIQPAQGEETLFDRWKEGRYTDVMHLRNRSSQHVKGSRTPVLQFIGHTSIESSVKNFQLVLETGQNEEEVIMQFGRLNKDTFTCDYRYPLSAIQAFGIALSSFDSRLSRD